MQFCEQQLWVDIIIIHGQDIGGYEDYLELPSENARGLILFMEPSYLQDSFDKEKEMDI